MPNEYVTTAEGEWLAEWVHYLFPNKTRLLLAGTERCHGPAQDERKSKDAAEKRAGGSGGSGDLYDGYAGQCYAGSVRRQIHTPDMKNSTNSMPLRTPFILLM